MRAIWFVGILFVLNFVAFVFVHESIHGEIYRHDGCGDVKFGVGVGFAYTECLDVGYVESANAVFNNMLNEVVGYNVELLIVTVYVLLIGYLFIKGV